MIAIINTQQSECCLEWLLEIVNFFHFNFWNVNVDLGERMSWQSEELLFTLAIRKQMCSCLHNLAHCCKAVELRPNMHHSQIYISQTWLLCRQSLKPGTGRNSSQEYSCPGSWWCLSPNNSPTLLPTSKPFFFFCFPTFAQQKQVDCSQVVLMWPWRIRVVFNWLSLITSGVAVTNWALWSNTCCSLPPLLNPHPATCFHLLNPCRAPGLRRRLRKLVLWVWD